MRDSLVVLHLKAILVVVVVTV